MTPQLRRPHASSLARLLPTSLQLLLLTVLTPGITGCGADADPDAPVTLSEANLSGFWRGHLSYDDNLEGTPPSGPLMLHLRGPIEGLDAFPTIMEQTGFDLDWKLGRWELADDQLITTLFDPVSGFIGPRAYEIRNLSANSLTLGFAGPPALTVELTRTQSCAGAGAWLDMQPDHEAATFGPDGRLHLLRGGVYTASVPGLCYPFVFESVRGTRIAVSPDNIVRVASMTLDGIELQSFPAPTDHRAMPEPELVVLGDRSTSTTYVYDHVRLGHAGTTPVVTFARGNDLLTWHQNAAGGWIANTFPILSGDGQTPTLFDVVNTAEGDLLIREQGATAALLFDGEQWRSIALPTHPTLGAPVVITFDPAGRLHAAFSTFRAGPLGFMDPMLVGRLDDAFDPRQASETPTGDASWTTTSAGTGYPVKLRAQPDGSYDLIALPARTSTAVGLYRITSLNSPRAWSARYVGDRVNPVSGLNGTYFAFEAGPDLLAQPWGAFSASQGPALVGGGGVAPFRASRGHWRNPSEERSPATADTTLVVTLESAVDVAVDFPSLGQRCTESCTFNLASSSLIPVHVQTEGVATLTTSTATGLGSNTSFALSDEDWAMAIEPDRLGQEPHTVHLRVEVVSPIVTDLQILESGPAQRLPLRMAADDSRIYWLYAEDASFGLQALTLSGEPTDAAPLSGLVAPGQMRATPQGLAIFTRFPEGPHLLRLDQDLNELSREPLPEPSRASAQTLHADGTALQIDALDNGTESRLLRISSTGARQELTLPLPRATALALFGDHSVVATALTESYPATLGDTEVDAHHHALAAFDAEGQPLWTQAFPTSAFLRPVTLAHGDALIVLLSQRAPHTWPQDHPLTTLPPFTGATLHHLLRLDPATGELLSVTSQERFATEGASFIATNSGVWAAASSPYELTLTYLDFERDEAHFSRTFSARLPGECLNISCTPGPAPLAALPTGALATLVAQTERATSYDRFPLPGAAPGAIPAAALLTLEPPAR